LPDVRAISPKPPRGKYAGIMAVATVAAVGCAAAVCLLMDAPGRVALLAGLAVTLGSLATFLPSILQVERQSWGLVVLGSSMARTMVILACALFFDQTRNLGDARTALWIGSMCGAGIALIVESAVSVRFLAAMDRSASSSQCSQTRPAAHA
jgi:hypothetical protein